MKALLALAAAAALAGCASYGDPYGYGYGYGGTYPSASMVYQSSSPGYGYYGGYPGYAYPTVRGQRDRDGDGIPNRLDVDRDGDGVPNELDRRPNNPRR